MRRTVWDDLREDARRFSRQYPETGHTLLHVPDRDADGAPEIDVECPREAIGGANPLASMLANARDTESPMRAIGVGSLDARILIREQRPTPDETGFVAEWFWCGPSGEPRAWPDQSTVIWTRLCGELWKLICGRVGELLPNAVTIDPFTAPSIGTDPNVIDSGLVMHWLAWSAAVAALRSKVGWRLSFRPTDESQLAEFAHAPQMCRQAPPFEAGHPVAPSMPANEPWLELAGWWHSTIEPAGAGLVATIDWLRKAEFAAHEKAEAVEKRSPHAITEVKTQESSDLPDDMPLSASDLAKIFAVEADPLRKRLERWRKKNILNQEDWIEHDSPAPNMPRYLYRVRIARPIIKEMKGNSASAQASSQRPAKYLRRSERPDS